MTSGILVIDIGGTTIKTAVVDDHGVFLSEPMRVPTPKPCKPEQLLALVEGMVHSAPAYDRISIGFPGPIKDGRILTAVNLGTQYWVDVALADLIRSRLGGHPTKIVNDADMQGYALISGVGLEFALILGTGVGTALYREGELMPHIEFAHHPLAEGKTYEQCLGAAAFRQAGTNTWNRRLDETLKLLERVMRPDKVYVSGGNARNIRPDLAKKLIIGDPDAGLRGGFGLWHASVHAPRQ